VSKATFEEGDDDVMRDREQPPLDQDKATGQALGVGDLQARRVIRDRLKGERRVAVGAERAVRVEGDPPGPAQHTDVEIEEPARVALGEQDREEGDNADHDEGDPEEDEHDHVRDDQLHGDNFTDTGNPVFDSGNGDDACHGDAGIDTATLCELVTGVP
jgi:hypothetical protein